MAWEKNPHVRRNMIVWLTQELDISADGVLKLTSPRGSVLIAHRGEKNHYLQIIATRAGKHKVTEKTLPSAALALKEARAYMKAHPRG